MPSALDDAWTTGKLAAPESRHIRAGNSVWGGAPESSGHVVVASLMDTGSQVEHRAATQYELGCGTDTKRAGKQDVSGRSSTQATEASSVRKMGA
jgi:hypothetical protein